MSVGVGIDDSKGRHDNVGAWWLLVKEQRMMIDNIFFFVMVFLAAKHAGNAKSWREYGKNGCSAINRIYELRSFFLPNLNIPSGQKLAAQHQKSKYARLEWFSFTSKLETLISFLSVDTAPELSNQGQYSQVMSLQNGLS